MPYNATKIRIKFDKKRLSTESLSNIYKILFFKKVSNYRDDAVGGIDPDADAEGRTAASCDNKVINNFLS